MGSERLFPGRVSRGGADHRYRILLDGFHMAYSCVRDSPDTDVLPEVYRTSVALATPLPGQGEQGDMGEPAFELEARGAAVRSNRRGTHPAPKLFSPSLHSYDGRSPPCHGNGDVVAQKAGRKS